MHASDGHSHRCLAGQFDAPRPWVPCWRGGSKPSPKTALHESAGSLNNSPYTMAARLFALPRRRTLADQRDLMPSAAGCHRDKDDPNPGAGLHPCSSRARRSLVEDLADLRSRSLSPEPHDANRRGRPHSGAAPQKKLNKQVRYVVRVLGKLWDHRKACWRDPVPTSFLIVSMNLSHRYSCHLE